MLHVHVFTGWPDAGERRPATRHHPCVDYIYIYIYVYIYIYYVCVYIDLHYRYVVTDTCCRVLAQAVRAAAPRQPTEREPEREQEKRTREGRRRHHPGVDANGGSASATLAPPFCLGEKIAGVESGRERREERGPRGPAAAAAEAILSAHASRLRRQHR